MPFLLKLRGERELGHPVGKRLAKQWIFHLIGVELPHLEGRLKFSERFWHRFKAVCGLTVRRRTNKKAKRFIDYVVLLIVWYANFLRWKVDMTQATGRCWADRDVYNMDQVPIKLWHGADRTLEERGKDVVRIKQGSRGDSGDKRAYTLVLTLRASGEKQMKPILIFRGKTDRCYNNEKHLYDPRVDVVMQKSAYYDTGVNVKYHALFRKHREEVGRLEHRGCLLVDNFKAQSNVEARTHAAAVSNVDLACLLENATSFQQPVDKHKVRYVQQEVGRLQDEYEYQNPNKFAGMTAGEMRVRATWWVGEAVEKLFKKAGKDGMLNLFTELGFLERPPAEPAAKLGSGYKFQGAPEDFEFQYSLNDASPRPEEGNEDDADIDERDNDADSRIMDDDDDELVPLCDEDGNTTPADGLVDLDDEYDEDASAAAQEEHDPDPVLGDESACECEYNLLEKVDASSSPWDDAKRGSIVAWRFVNGWDIGRIVKTLVGEVTSYRVYYHSDQRAVTHRLSAEQHAAGTWVLLDVPKHRQHLYPKNNSAYN